MTTPTHLSMSHEGEETLSQIVEGLEDVTPGPWYQDRVRVHAEEEDDCIAEFFDGPCYANAAHFARCHPDAIRAIAAYVAAVEKERDDALTLPLLLALPRILGEWG